MNTIKMLCPETGRHADFKITDDLVALLYSGGGKRDYDLWLMPGDPSLQEKVVQLLDRGYRFRRGVR